MASTSGYTAESTVLHRFESTACSLLSAAVLSAAMGISISTTFLHQYLCKYEAHNNAFVVALLAHKLATVLRRPRRGGWVGAVWRAGDVPKAGGQCSSTPSSHLPLPSFPRGKQTQPLLMSALTRSFLGRAAARTTAWCRSARPLRAFSLV